MKKKIERIVMILIILQVFLFSFACSSKEVPDYSQYEGTKVLNIGAWNGPPNNYTTQDTYNEIAESGLNFIIDINSGGIANKLEYSQKAGIKYMMNGVFFNEFQGLAEYVNHPACMGIIGRDEPSVPAFQENADRLKSFKSLYKDKMFFINLLPCYATSEQLGTKFYTDYVSEFARIVDPELYVFDGYSLLVSSTGTTSIESGMLFNLEAIATEAQKQNKPYWAFLQTMGYGGNRRNVDKDDMRFQYYTYLAYGYSGLLHFCYWTPPGAEFPPNVYAMIERDGTRTATYDAVKQVNEEILGFDHVLLSYKWTGTMTVLGEKEILCNNFQRLSYALKEHNSIESVTASENAIVGTFEDGEYNGFMLVNFTDPAQKKSNEVTITFKDSSKALLYKDGKPQTVKLKKGVYTTKLAPGEGQFIIPL